MSHRYPDPAVACRRVALAIVAILLGYGIAAWSGLPQEGTRLIVADKSHAEEHGADEHVAVTIPPAWTGIPFLLLLGAIAIFPLIPPIEHWWASNLHRLYLSGGLALVSLGYYLFLYDGPIVGHWPAHHVALSSGNGLNIAAARVVLENALLNEYIPFMVLLFSLFTIAGGIRVEGDVRATPRVNTVFLGLGGLLASFLGTTGAAMLLIRPLLETNAERKYVQHTIIFFIFIVCNCGGCLTPLGDPPLFLGYLHGVPFLWTFVLWKEWLAVNGLLLLVYFVWDHFFAYPRETPSDLRLDVARAGRLRIAGLGVNGPMLIGVILGVALLDPSQPVPGTSWHPWLFLREGVQLGLVACSLWLGPAAPRATNRFTFHAIEEVAALFLGIFITMQPVLQILHEKGPSLGLDTAREFFWVTGSLSSVLDNAPTYLVFFETARALGGENLVAGVAWHFLVGISLGAVFLGAMTYIGNGPNFMVKAIAEQSGVRMPSFFGYLVYSGGILWPILFLMSQLFL